LTYRVSAWLIHVSMSAPPYNRAHAAGAYVSSRAATVLGTPRLAPTSAMRVVSTSGCRDTASTPIASAAGERNAVRRMAGSELTNWIALSLRGPFHGQSTANTWACNLSGSRSAARSPAKNPPSNTTVHGGSVASDSARGAH